MVTAVSAIDEEAWTAIDYTMDGIAEVAECDHKGHRLVVRRTRLVGHQATLWPEWRHFAFLTDQGGTAVAGGRLPSGARHRGGGYHGPEGRCGNGA
ncbi:MAG: hypothetical protein ACYDDZ_15770, partial [Acidimicrobiales bacterium]